MDYKIEMLLYMTTIAILLFGCFVITDIAIFQPYTVSENYCQNIGMELAGWSIGGSSLTCRSLEGGYVVESRFKQIDGKYYPVREES